jgi:hypothetical protein
VGIDNTDDPPPPPPPPPPADYSATDQPVVDEGRATPDSTASATTDTAARSDSGDLGPASDLAPADIPTTDDGQAAPELPSGTGQETPVQPTTEPTTGEAVNLPADTEPVALPADSESADSGPLADQESSDKSDQTKHGADRTADPSRLDAAAQSDVIAHPTQEYTQGDGANVYVQQVGDRYNVVVQGERGAVTNLKTIDESSLSRLAKNYDWTRK